MKKSLFLIIFTTISLLGFSQTKRIAHRSHSGSDNTFSITNGFDNFGLPPAADSLRKLNSKSKKDTLKLKVSPKDSLKTKPLKVPVDTIKHALNRKEVTEILTEIGNICSR